MTLPMDTSPEAINAAQANAAYRAANNLPIDPTNIAVIQSQAAQQHAAQQQQIMAQQDAARELAKHNEAFSQPRNDVRVAPQAALDAYAAQRSLSIGGDKPLPQSAEAHAAFIKQPGYVENTNVITGRAATQNFGAPLQVSKYSQELQNQPARSTVPINDLSSGMGGKNVPVTNVRSDYTSIGSMGELLGYRATPILAVPGVNVYTPLGEKEAQLRTDSKIIYSPGGAFNLEQLIPSTMPGFTRIFPMLTAGGGDYALQSGMVGGKAQTIIVYDQYGNPTWSKEQQALVDDIRKNPDKYSNQGSDLYGGVVPLDGRTMQDWFDVGGAVKMPGRYLNEAMNFAMLPGLASPNTEKKDTGTQFLPSGASETFNTDSPFQMVDKITGKLSSVSPNWNPVKVNVIPAQEPEYRMVRPAPIDRIFTPVQPEKSESIKYQNQFGGSLINNPAWNSTKEVGENAAYNVNSAMLWQDRLNNPQFANQTWIEPQGWILEKNPNFGKDYPATVMGSAEKVLGSSVGVTPANQLGTGIFADVSNFFSSAPGLGFVYSIGASVPKTTVEGLDTIVSNNPVLSNVKAGGQVFELQSDYDKYSVMGATPEVLAAQARYSDASRNLSGGFDPTTAMTYSLGKGLQDLGINYNDMITSPVSKIVGENPAGQFVTGFVSVPGGLVTMAGMAIPGGESLIFHNAGAIPAIAAAGTAMMIRDSYTSATTNPAGFAGQMLGQALIIEGVKAGYVRQPYRIGIESAEIAPSSGQGGPTARYSSLAVTKLSGQDYQISQISTAIIGKGGKIVSPVDAILKSDLLKSITNAEFTTRMNTFPSADDAMSNFYNVAESGPRSFYHATQTGDFIDGLLSRGSVEIGGGNKEGALFFAQPDTILTQYSKGGGVPVALRLQSTPTINPEFIKVVEELKGGRGAFGTDFAKASGQLPEGFYPGLRAAAGKAYGRVGIEEEYIVSPKSTLYLKSARSVTGPSGEPWLLVDVSLNKPLLPDIKLGVVQTASNIANLRPTIGVPRVPEEYFKFGSPEKTFAPNTPLETSIVKVLAPEEALKYNLGYGVREITSGSGARLGQATTAISEVVTARNFPNSGKVTEAIVQTEIDYGVKMYGSSIQKGVGTEQGIVTLTRAPNDIDLYVPEVNGKSMGLSFANDVTKAINRASGKTVVTVDESGTVSLIDKTGKLFDIHNENPTLQELLSQGSNPNKPASPYYGIGMKIEPFLETPEGIGVMTYSEQVGRKLSGTSEFTLEPRTTIGKEYPGGPEEFSVTGKIGPRFEGRMKDIPDFYTGEKGSITLMERSANPITRAMAGRANNMLEQWLDTWGEPAAKSIRENYKTSVDANAYSIDMTGIVRERAISPSIRGYVYPESSLGGFSRSPSLLRSSSQGLVNSVESSPNKSAGSKSDFNGSISAMLSQEIVSPSPSISRPSSSPAPVRISQSISITPDFSNPIGSPSPKLEPRPSTTPSVTGSSLFVSLLIPPYSPSSSLYQGPPGPPGSPGSPRTPPPPPYYEKLLFSPRKDEQIYEKKKKRKPQTSTVFREVMPIITPIEEMRGFKGVGKSFFRAIGNQQVLEIKPQSQDYLNYVDVDQDVRELKQKDSGNRVSNMTGMNFYRTATKQEKAKTGKPIMTYTPTQQEINMAKLTGMGSNNAKKGKKKSWF